MTRHTTLRLFAVAALILVPMLATAQVVPGERRSGDFRVVGYLPEYRFGSVDPGVGEFLTDLVWFSVEPKPSGDLDLARLKPEHLRMLQAIKERHGVRLLLCVGGWERSRRFAPLAASERASERFATSLVEFCRTNRFDGVDLDWEHPANAKEATDYAKLLTAIHERFKPRGLELTIAMAGWQSLPTEAFRHVDRVHLMAYDGPGRHSTLEFAQAEVNRLVRAGAPPEKVCLGVPFYGRSVTKPDVTLTYAEIVRKFEPGPEVDEVDGVYFNGPATIERKVRFARERGLAGIMIWEIGQDRRDGRSLLVVIRKALPAASAK